jgi:hypothetical protein
MSGCPRTPLWVRPVGSTSLSAAEAILVEALPTKCAIALAWLVPTVGAKLLGTPAYGSWWYPDPGRRLYHLKLSMYAFRMGAADSGWFGWIVIALGAILILWNPK